MGLNYSEGVGLQLLVPPPPLKTGLNFSRLPASHSHSLISGVHGAVVTTQNGGNKG